MKVPGLGKITVRPWWGWLHPATWHGLWLWARWVRCGAVPRRGAFIRLDYRRRADSWLTMNDGGEGGHWPGHPKAER